jgi:hypothetical protein
VRWDTDRTANRVDGSNAYPETFHKPVGLELDRQSEAGRSFRHNSSEGPRDDRHVAVHAFRFLEEDDQLREQRTQCYE